MNKKKVLGLSAIVVVIIGMLFVYNNFKEKPVEGSKAVSIEVIDSAEQSTVYEVKTDAEFLSQAMEEADGLEFSGEEGQFGMVIESVNGEKAVYEEDGAYWSIMVNGEYGNYGIDEQPIEDGDTFQIVYTSAESYEE